MIKVKLNDGKIIEVTRNVAHGYVERDEGEIYTHRMMSPTTKVIKKVKKINKEPIPVYNHEDSIGEEKEYKTK